MLTTKMKMAALLTAAVSVSSGAQPVRRVYQERQFPKAPGAAKRKRVRKIARAGRRYNLRHGA